MAAEQAEEEMAVEEIGTAKAGAFEDVQDENSLSDNGPMPEIVRTEVADLIIPSKFGIVGYIDLNAKKVKCITDYYSNGEEIETVQEIAKDGTVTSERQIKNETTVSSFIKKTPLNASPPATVPA